MCEAFLQVKLRLQLEPHLDPCTTAMFPVQAPKCYSHPDDKAKDIKQETLTLYKNTQFSPFRFLTPDGGF